MLYTIIQKDIILLPNVFQRIITGCYLLSNLLALCSLAPIRLVEE